jgi:hypothetical protein
VTHDLVTTAVVTVDDLLDCIGYDVVDRARLSAQWAAPTRAGGDDYRHRQPELRALLASDDPGRAAGLYAFLAPRRAAVVGTPAPDVARSHVHMHLNRLLTPPVTEAAVLELLRRTRIGLQRSSTSNVARPSL